ncbi:MAG: C2 family cysteine protease [Myxococcota bacterium]|nr:C2 family cysteine protease [Myxococcota bacterium]
MSISIGDKRSAPLAPRAPDVTTAAPAAQKAAPSAPVNAARNQESLELAKPTAAPLAETPAPVFAVPTDVYKVKSGDSLGAISTRFGNDLKTVVADNNIANANQISIGQPVKLRDTVLLTVEKGDTLQGLSAQFGMKEADLAAANKLTAGAALTAGSQLKLPGGVFYTVKAGDNLSAIANRYGTTAQAIAKGNELTNANLIKIGQKLVVVSTQVPAPTPDLLKDPSVMKDHRGSANYADVAGGKLVVDGISADDVKQGQAGDCYFLVAISGLAKSHPEVIQNALKDNGDGSFTATFYESEYGPVDPKDVNGEWVEKFTPVKVEIDGDIPKEYGSAVYATGGTDKELWAPLLEKAYAKWKGGYEEIGNGGWPHDALSQLTGKPAESIWMDAKNPPNITKVVQGYLASGQVVCASTKDEKATSGSGIVGNHAYTVLGTLEKDGKSYVQLRNPWGNTEFGNDGKDDGVFMIPAAKFRQLFDSLSVSQAA